MYRDSGNLNVELREAQTSLVYQILYIGLYPTNCNSVHLRQSFYQFQVVITCRLISVDEGATNVTFRNTSIRVGDRQGSVEFE